MKINQRYSTWAAGASFSLALALVASCGKKSSSSASSDSDSSIILSGQLAVAGSTSTGLSLASVSVDDLSMYCVTFTLPPVAGTGDLDAEGKFSVTLATTGVSVGCFVLNQAQEVLGTLVFKDPNKKKLNGEASTNDRLAFDGGESNLGSITLDLDAGQVVVDISQITIKKKDTAAVAAIGDTHDFTGVYKFAATDIELPKGYSRLCTEAEAEAERNSNSDVRKCDGPALGMPIYVKRISGKAVSDGSDVYGLSIWQSKELDNLCGNKLGFSYTKGKEQGVDFSASGVAEGDFNWAPGFEDGWKDVANATARHPYMAMEQVDDFKGYPGMKQFIISYHTWSCGPEGCTDGASQSAPSGSFQFHANTKESGCRDASGKPVRLDDWSNMKCENTALTGASVGLMKNVCTKSENNVTYTCTNIGGMFSGDGTPIVNAIARFPEDFSIMAAEGALCSSIDTSNPTGKINQLRCYAESSYDERDGGGNACVRDVRSNWAAKTPEEFILGSDGPVRAKGQHVFERFEYDSATSGSLRGENRNFRGVQDGDNWTECEIVEVFSMSLSKIPDSSDLYGEMVMTQNNVSAKPACKASDFASAQTNKLAFKLIKQP